MAVSHTLPDIWANATHSEKQNMTSSCLVKQLWFIAVIKVFTQGLQTLKRLISVISSLNRKQFNILNTSDVWRHSLAPQQTFEEHSSIQHHQSISHLHYCYKSLHPTDFGANSCVFPPQCLFFKAWQSYPSSPSTRARGSIPAEAHEKALHSNRGHSGSHNPSSSPVHQILFFLP